MIIYNFVRNKNMDVLSRLFSDVEEIGRKTLESIMDSNLIEGSH